MFYWILSGDNGFRHGNQGIEWTELDWNQG